MSQEGKEKDTIVDIWNNTPADQDEADLLWSTSDETSLQSLIKDDITKDKTDIGKDKQKISQIYVITIYNGYPN